MCGIVSAQGRKIHKFIETGLTKLEYRGYDGFGVYQRIDGRPCLHKELGSYSASNFNLSENCDMALGHTRWATNGDANKIENLHPHFSYNKRVCIVHNGVVENLEEIQQKLAGRPYKLFSDTDSEIIANYLSYSSIDGLCALLPAIKGKHAIVGIFDNVHFCYVNGLPLYIGYKDSNTYVASDISVFEGLMDTVHKCEDNVVYRQDLKNQYGAYSKNPVTVPLVQQHKPTFKHKMLAEINEQKLAYHKYDEYDWRTTPKSLHLVGCGSSYNAALFAKSIARIPVRVEIASEFNHYLANNEELAVFISQSGETRDVIDCLKYKSEKTRLLTNNVNSQLAYNFPPANVVDTNVGKEEAVAATKTFTGQCVSLMKLLEDNRYPKINIQANVDRLMQVFAREKEIEELADRVKDYKHIVFLGSGQDYPIALEAALKFKEVCYIHAEGMPAAEMKHGPIALVDKDILFIVLCSYYQDAHGIVNKIKINIDELSSRKANILSVGSIRRGNDSFHIQPNTNQSPFDTLTLNIMIQLLCYHVAVKKGLNPDRPRNLAKSVTV